MPEVISQPGGAGTERSTTSGPLQSKDRKAANFDPTEDEKTVVGAWLKRVERAEDVESAKKWREDLARLRKYERGTQTVDAQKSRTNMVYATLAAQLPKLYAKNPAIAVSPTDAVPKDQVAKVKKFSETAEKVIRKMLVEEGRLKKRAKSNIRSTSVTSFGVLKLTYQRDYRGDPIAVRRIEDTQDNLARVEGLIRDLKKTDDPSELAKKRDDLQANLKSLTSKNEVKLFKGMACDRVKSEDFIVLDDNIAEFDEYVDASALGQKIWMTVSDAKTLFKMELHGATRYGRPRTDKNENKVDDTPADEQFICVLELWDKRNGVIRTTAKGMNRWLRDPYAPPQAPQRWYPFYVLGFNTTEGEWRPLSDVEMLVALQEEYDRTRQNFADAREKAVPVLIFRKSGELVENDVKSITDRKNKDTIGIEGNPSIPLAQDLMWFQPNPLDPTAYDVSPIRNDMDIVSGTSDAGRSNLIEPKTATEAEIMNEAMQSRMGERRDTHEDLLSEMGEASLEIFLRDLSKEEVVQIAGADSEWPETPRGAEEAFNLVSVKVRAGSSGKPNIIREREQWGQLLPIISDTMKQVVELRAAGNYDAGEAVLELLRETLRRYDEYLDLDSIIPPTQKDANGQPVANQQAAAQLVQANQALIQCKEELAACQEELAKAKQVEQAKAVEAASKAEISKADQARKDEEFNREQARRDADAAHKQQMEKDEMARRDRLEVDARDRADRAGAEKLAHELKVKAESARIGADSKQHEQAAAAAAQDKGALELRLESLLTLMETLVGAVNALAQEVKDNTEAERVAEYGDDGMPKRVRLVRKSRRSLGGVSERTF